MRASRKIEWDSAFFMERAHGEWHQAPRAESERLKFKRLRFNVQEALRAWRQIGVHNDAGSIRQGIAKLRAWERRKVRIKK
jgi:hypothetical protein